MWGPPAFSVGLPDGEKRGGQRGLGRCEEVSVLGLRAGSFVCGVTRPHRRAVFQGQVASVCVGARAAGTRAAHLVQPLGRGSEGAPLWLDWEGYVPE